MILRLLRQSPIQVSASGGAYLTKGTSDVTVSNLQFSDDSRAHIFVSWLHPYKEQRLVVVGDQKMAIFNDLNHSARNFVYILNRLNLMVLCPF